VKRRAECDDIDLHVAVEIGNAEAAAEIDFGRLGASFIGNSRRERDRLAERLGQRRPVETLRAGVDVQAPPLGAGVDQAAHDRGDAVMVDAEGGGDPAHLHPGALEGERRVDPDG
jgi:hypothetical protein